MWDVARPALGQILAWHGPSTKYPLEIFFFNFMQEVVACMVNTVGLQWLELTGAMKISSGQR